MTYPHLIITTTALLLITVFLTDRANGQSLNDTGITFGGNYPEGISDDCTATIREMEVSTTRRVAFADQQDCATGASRSMLAAEKNPFGFEKIAADGTPLEDDASQWHCVIDRVAGLMWEVKRDTRDPGLHSVNDRFTWYNSNRQRNDGDIGDWNRSGNHCSGYKPDDPRTYCHIEQFAERVNRVGLCGHQNWRVPTRHELTGLVHFGRFQPSIDTDYFPHTRSTFYWATNPMVGRTLEAWAINFEFGGTSPLRKTDPRPVRLVRTLEGRP